MFVTTDSRTKEFKQVVAIGEKDDPEFSLYDYVLIKDEDGKRCWIGQITAPNMNYSPSGDALDPTILYAIKLSQSKAGIQLAETVEAWQISLLGEYKDSDMLTLRRRPKPGAAITRLDRVTTISVLNLPKHLEDSPHVIGYLLNADDVALSVNHEIFTHHVMVSGGTGSGKSNTGANLIKQAASLGFTVFLYDAKTDYRLMDKPNSDKRVEDVWRQFAKYKLVPQKANNLTRVAIFGVGRAGATNDYSIFDYVLGFRTSDFDPYLFAGLFFDEKQDRNQYESFASVCFDMRQVDNQGNQPQYSLDDVLAEVKKRRDAYMDQIKNAKAAKDGKADYVPDPDAKTIHEATARTILYKVEQQKKRMMWLDKTDRSLQSVGSANAFNKGSQKVISFSSNLFAEKGGIVHVDCGGLDERTYALFLSRFMNMNQGYLSQKQKTPTQPARGIVEFVDEAHRLFSNDSRYSDLLAAAFNRAMVEGRSLNHGVIISLQNSSQVPPLVLNNVNTHIVMRQNNRDVAKTATQTMEREFTDWSLTLSSGEALVKMFESRSTVIAKMAPSPFELERTDNAE